MTNTQTNQRKFICKWMWNFFSHLILAAGIALGLDGLAVASDLKLPEPITLSSGWLMQDVAQVKETGDAISKVGFAPNVFQPTPYSPPSTVSANPPTATKVPDALRFAPRGPRGNGGASPTAMAEGWPLNPESNRPSFSSGWVQAPAPSSASWYSATVPGTVLTTLVGNNVFPDPLFGEN